MSDIVFYTDLSEKEIANRLAEIFNDNNKFNVEIKKLHDIWYLSERLYKTPLTGLKYRLQFNSLHIQIRIQGGEKAKVFISTQSTIIAMVLAIMLLILTWSVIIGMDISGKLDSKIVYLLGGIGTVMVLFFVFMSKRIERKIVEFMKQHLMK